MLADPSQVAAAAVVNKMRSTFHAVIEQEHECPCLLKALTVALLQLAV